MRVTVLVHTAVCPDCVDARRLSMNLPLLQETSDVRPESVITCRKEDLRK